MQPFILFSLIFLSSFHGQLISAQQLVFNFSSGKIDKNSLTSLEHGSVDSSGTLTLDASTGDAQAFYYQPIDLLDSAGRSVLSFTSFFTFASNATNGNGTIVFALTPDVSGAVSSTEARKTLTIEFNTSCSTGSFNGSEFYGGRGFGQGGPGWGGGGGGGFFGGLGGFQVAEYANNTSILIDEVSGYGPGYSSYPNATVPYFCSQQPPQDLSNPTFEYQVVLEYNASTDTIWVGSPSCGAGLARTTQFNVQNLSGIIPNNVYVGFLASGGGIFNISQWNFTGNTNTNSVSSLALSNEVSTTPGSNSGNGRGGNSRGGLKKGYVIGFSVLGAAIGVAAVLLVCCLLCARRRRDVTSARFVGKSVHGGTIPESAVVFDAKKPHALPAKTVLGDKDTMPLRPNSAFHGSTGAASWLQPVAPR